MRIWNPIGFVLLGLLVGLLLGFMAKKAFSEPLAFDYGRLSLSTTYEALEGVNAQLNETSQRIRALQKELHELAKVMDGEEKKKIRP